ncbi:hypothetical protein, partial [Pyramidobacter piscolens]
MNSITLKKAFCRALGYPKVLLRRKSLIPSERIVCKGAFLPYCFTASRVRSKFSGKTEKHMPKITTRRSLFVRRAIAYEKPLEEIANKLMRRREPQRRKVSSSQESLPAVEYKETPKTP